MENNDYQYFCVLTNGGVLTDSLPMLALPGSYIYMSGKKFYVAEYKQPIDDEDNEYDVCVYCEEVPNNVDMKAIRRDLKINNILNK